jgi:Ca2+/H+ antiporter
MTEKDERRSVIGYVLGTTLGVVALALTAWAGLRRRREESNADEDIV